MDGAATQSGFTAMIQKWYQQPFNAQGSAGQWFLFFGLVIVIIFAWNMILRFITEDL